MLENFERVIRFQVSDWWDVKMFVVVVCGGGVLCVCVWCVVAVKQNDC